MVTRIAVGPRGRGVPITVDERCPDVVVLLFLRHAWGIESDRLPATDPVPVTGTTAAPAQADFPVWQAQWRSIWGSFHQHKVVRDRFGSAWQDRYGSTSIDLDALHRWRDALTMWPPPPLKKTPEWLARDAVLAAQDRGLSNVFVLPSSQVWFEARDSGVLLVSRASRADPNTYTQALNAFG